MVSTSCWVIIIFIGFLLVLFTIVGIPIIVYEVVVKPKGPTFTLDRASITGFNLTSNGHLNAFFDVVLRANNPNHKLKLSYGAIRVSIFKNKQNLARDALSKFSQHKKNVTFLRAQPIALNVALKKSTAFDFGIESGMGYLNFDVFTTARLNGNNLEVNCRHVVVNVTSSSTIVNDDNLGKFQSIGSFGCSVFVYTDD